MVVKVKHVEKGKNSGETCSYYLAPICEASRAERPIGELRSSVTALEQLARPPKGSFQRSEIFANHATVVKFYLDGVHDDKFLDAYFDSITARPEFKEANITKADFCARDRLNKVLLTQAIPYDMF